MDRQTDIRIDINSKVVRKIYSETGRSKGRWADREIERWTNTKTDREITR